MNADEPLVRSCLQSYLELYWLRPETALWRTLDALVLKELDPGPIELDLGCGDGFNSYLLSGGVLPFECDDFVDVASISPEQFFRGASDMYDAPPAAVRAVPAPPAVRIRYGLDRKAGLLRKAQSLGLYDALVQADANEPLPFADRSVGSVFSNILYWVDRLEVVLAETARVLRDGGRATVLVPDEELKAHYIHHQYVVGRGWEWMALLDMGRHTHIRDQYTRSEWERRFAAAGLRVRDHRSYLPGRFIEIQEVGLRPLSPVLVDMANRLAPLDRVEIKQRWVEYCLALAMPMLTSGWLEEAPAQHTFHAYVLERA